jgi:hypothetical protein
MRKYFYKLTIKDYLTLLTLIILGFGWLLVDQLFFPEVYQRIIAFIALMSVLYYLQFLVNRPLQVIYYANSIALITVTFIVAVSLIMHVAINNDFTYKSVLIWFISGSLPYVTGLVYLKTKQN